MNKFFNFTKEEILEDGQFTLEQFAGLKEEMRNENKQYYTPFNPHATMILKGNKLSPEEAMKYSGALVKVTGIDPAATKMAGRPMRTCEVQCPAGLFFTPLEHGALAQECASNPIVIAIPAENLNCAVVDVRSRIDPQTHKRVIGEEFHYAPHY